MKQIKNNFLTKIKSFFFQNTGINQVVFFAILIIAFNFSYLASAQNKNNFHICYFSMNNEKEFLEMQEFTQKINSQTNSSISVKEYMKNGEDPTKSFQKMINQAQCDGLVISGHHTGSWGGSRASGTLGINFLEQLSCNENFYDWFNDINALWLQGCRTLGTGDLSGDSQESNADFHTLRVGALLEVDHLEQSFADLNVEFSATLDQDNPISSRYLRVFPTATVFGWTKTSPGELARSEFSIPFHLAHIANLFIGHFPSHSPHRGRWSHQSAQQYHQALTSILNPHNKRNSKIAQQAWKNHGNGTFKNYAFNNTDLNSYLPLISQKDETLKTVHHYDCLLRNSMDEKILLSVLDFIKEDPSLIRYTYNSVLEKLKLLKESNPKTHYHMVEKLKNGIKVQNFLLQKLTNKRLGILMKIHYFAFYEEIYGTNQKMREQIQDKVTQSLYNIPSSSYDEIDFKQTLLSSLSKYGYLNNEKGFALLEDILSNEKSERLRQEAVRSVEFIDETVGFALLQQSIQDKNSLVRWESAKASEYINENQALNILNQGLKDRRSLVRKEVLRVSTKLGTETSFFLQKGLEDKDVSVRQTSLQLAGDIGVQAIAFIELGIKDSSPLVRLEAIKAGEFIGKPALHIIELGLKDSDSEVRAEAQKAMQNM